LIEIGTLIRIGIGIEILIEIGTLIRIGILIEILIRIEIKVCIIIGI
jgi:hypothetical protein